MTDAELNVIARALAPVVRDLIAKSLEGLTARMTAVEARPVVHGRDGLPGVPGPSGERGLTGERGPGGSDGTAGLHGKDGADGVAGKDGADGLAGKDGAPGSDGQKGLDGADGLHGKDGADGLHGKDGRDGITMGVDDLQAVDYDGEHTVTLKFRQGDHVKDFPIKFANQILKGIWKDDIAYEIGDCVILGGGQWTAKSTSVGKRPGTNDGAIAWVMSTKPGRDGKVGPQGPEGQLGPRGEKGTDGRNSYS